MEDLLEFKNVSLSLGNLKLRDLSFSLKKGSIMGLIGENGAGKTTIFRLVLNNIGKDSGEIKVFEKDSVQDEVFIKNNIGYVPAESYLFDNKSLWKIGEKFRIYYDNWDSKILKEYAEKFNIPYNYDTGDFSTGMKKKAMIALALAHNPKILILDEPTAGLDPTARMELLDILREFVQDEEKSVLISSHITSDLDKVADYITLIHKGRILESASIDEIQEKYVLVKGNINELSSKECFIGIREYEKSFEGLLLKNKLDRIPCKEKIKIPNVEELLNYYVWGDRQ